MKVYYCGECDTPLGLNGSCRCVGHQPPLGNEGWTPDDGGRAAAGYKGMTGDCVTRAIAIATELPYQVVYNELRERCKAVGSGGRKRPFTPRTGVPRRVYERWLIRGLGWEWQPTLHIGKPTRVHLTKDEVLAFTDDEGQPVNRVIVRLSKHIAAVIDGIVHDTHDPSRDGKRCVYGYYYKVPVHGGPWEARWRQGA